MRSTKSVRLSITVSKKLDNVLSRSAKARKTSKTKYCSEILFRTHAEMFRISQKMKSKKRL